MLRDSYVEIDLNQWERNMDLLEAELGGVPILAVLKGNAYGHGALEMAKVMESRGIHSFAVATLNEALQLRKEIKGEILIFGPTPRRLHEEILRGNFIQSIGSFEEGKDLLDTAKVLNLQSMAEIKVDTGLHRWGFPATKESEEEILALFHKGLAIKGIYSHLSLTSLEEDEKQLDLFMEFTEGLRRRGLDVPRHIADSIAGIDRPRYRLDKVRLGSALYGMHSFKKELPVLPIASLKTRIARIVDLKPGEGVGYDYLWKAEKPTKLATLPLGYVDGLSRSMSGKGYVLIRGKEAPLRGLMSMDSLSVDVGDFPELEVGEEVLVFGPGLQGELTIEEIALLIHTNKNQLLSSMSLRLPRMYRRKDKSWIRDDLAGV